MVRTSPRFDGAEAQQETARTPRSGNLGKLARVPKRKPGRFRARGRLGNRTLFEQPSLERSDSFYLDRSARHTDEAVAERPLDLIRDLNLARQRVRSSHDAKFTVSPQTSYENLSAPMTPAMTGPLARPTRIFRFTP